MEADGCGAPLSNDASFQMTVKVFLVGGGGAAKKWNLLWKFVAQQPKSHSHI